MSNRRGLVVNIDALLAVLFTIFIVMIPKAGISLGGLPLQASVLLGSSLAVWGWLIAIKDARLLRRGIGLFFVTVAFAFWYGQVLFYLSVHSLGARDIARMVFLLNSLIGLGIVYLIDDRIRFAEGVISGICFGFKFLIFYAFLQILFGAEAVAIQNVTAIYEDTFDEVLDRHNRLHGLDSEIYKLFGTYNNGNIFSICLIIIGPIAISQAKTAFRKTLLLACLNFVIIFSASTSAYIGIAVVNILFFIHLIRISPILATAAPAVLFASAYVYVFVFCAGLNCLSLELLRGRLLERDLTNNTRWDKVGMWLDSMSESPLSFLFGQMYGIETYVFEVMPLAVFQFFGVLVFTAFFVFYFSWLRPLQFGFHKAGLIAYLPASFGDGVLWTTPTPYLLGIALGAAAILDRRNDVKAKLLKSRRVSGSGQLSFGR